MDDLTPDERLDVGWAHLLQGATSGAFTNPYEVRAQLRHIVYGEPAPPPKPSPGMPLSGRSRGSSRITPDRLDKLAAANERFKEFRAARVAPQ
jgi:hypothetical protein